MNFFDINKFSMRRDGDKVTSGSDVEVADQKPCHSVTSFLVWKSCGSEILSL